MKGNAGSRFQKLIRKTLVRQSFKFKYTLRRKQHNKRMLHIDYAVGGLEQRYVLYFSCTWHDKSSSCFQMQHWQGHALQSFTSFKKQKQVLWRFLDPVAMHQKQQICPWSFKKRHECFPVEASESFVQVLNEQNTSSWNKIKYQKRHMKGLNGRVRSKMRANVLISW